MRSRTPTQNPSARRPASLRTLALLTAPLVTASLLVVSLPAAAAPALLKDAGGSRWSVAASVDSSRCIDAAKTSACAAGAAGSGPEAATEPAPTAVSTVATVNLAYAVSKRVSLGLTAASRVGGGGPLDPIADLTTTLPWSRRAEQQVSFAVALPYSKESQEAHLTSQDTLTYSLSTMTHRVGLGLSLFISHSNYASDNPASAAPAATAGPTAPDAAADPNAPPLQVLAEQGISSFVFIPLSHHWALRSAVMLSEGTFGPGEALWITTADVGEVAYSAGNTTLSAGLELAHVGLKPALPETPTAKAGVAVQLGGHGADSRR